MFHSMRTWAGRLMAVTWSGGGASICSVVSRLPLSFLRRLFAFHQESEPVGHLHAVGDPQLRVGVLEMVLHGGHSDEQLRGDLLIGPAAEGERRDLPLPRGEAIQPAL